MWCGCDDNEEDSTTGVLLAVLLQRRSLKSRLDLLRKGSKDGRSIITKVRVANAEGTQREFKS